MFDASRLRQDFPIFQQKVRGKPLIYLDSTASSQKPFSVVQAMNDCYLTYYANVHRGIYELSEKASAAYEEARRKVARFINARSWREVIFTRNATESINLVSYSWARHNLNAGDVIVLSEMEHHSNIVPWQQVARAVGARIAFVPLGEQGYWDMDAFDQLLWDRVRLVAITHMSNVLGTIVPVEQVIDKAHEVGAIVLIDGAQSVPHMPVDVQSLGMDFLAFSGHKMLGPSGIGVLYGKQELLQDMPPFLTGGDMIRRVTPGDADWNELPWKFEAGTPAIVEAIGLVVCQS